MTMFTRKRKYLDLTRCLHEYRTVQCVCACGNNPGYNLHISIHNKHATCTQHIIIVCTCMQYGAYSRLRMHSMIHTSFGINHTLNIINYYINHTFGHTLNIKSINYRYNTKATPRRSQRQRYDRLNTVATNNYCVCTVFMYYHNDSGFCAFPCHSMSIVFSVGDCNLIQPPKAMVFNIFTIEPAQY